MPRDDLLASCVAPVVLVSAPAGMGKTVAISQWVRAASLPYVWLTLDEEDASPHRFIESLVAAVELAELSFSREFTAFASGSVAPPPRALATAVTKELETAAPLVLVLDNYHLLPEDSPVHMVVQEIACRLPHGLRLLIGTRGEPPIRTTSLRAAGQLEDVGARQLQFNTAEACDLLYRRGQTGLSEPQVARLTRALEGWAAGFSLAAAALRNGRSIDGFLAQLDEGNSDVQTYLAEDVLRLLPEEQRYCLERAAVLDCFCDDLLAALCQPCSCDCHVVSQLRDRGLFLVALDDRERWFRFHPSFRSLLRRRLEAKLDHFELRTLHQRAARWFREHGRLEEAVEHYLKADDVAAGVQLVKDRRFELMNDASWRRLGSILSRFAPEVVHEDAVLASTQAMVFEGLGDMRAALDQSTHVHELLSLLDPCSQEHAVVSGELAVFAGLDAILRGDGAATLSAVADSSRLVPEQNEHVHGLLVAGRILGTQMAGNWKAVEQLASEVLTAPRMSDRENRGFRRSHVWVWACMAYAMEGSIECLERSAALCLESARSQGALEAEGYALYFWALSHYVRSEYAVAQSYLDELLAVRNATRPSHLVHSAILQALVYLAQGEADAARAHLESTATLFLEDAQASLSLQALRCCQVEVELRAGNIALAERQAVQLDCEATPVLWYYYVPQLTHVRLAVAGGTSEELSWARRELATLEAFCRRAHRNLILVSVLAFRSVVCEAAGQPEEAETVLAEAIGLAAPSSSVQPLRDAGPTLLPIAKRLVLEGAAAKLVRALVLETTMPELGPQSAPAPICDPRFQQLTNRELDVLELAAQRLQNKEIAERLFVSPHTVKEHLKNIYRKLEVNNRQAATRLAISSGIFRTD